jgi:tRNA modification GTPase
MELVASENTRIARLATRQLAGEFSNKIAKIRNSLISLASAVSADLDFSEEDVPNISKSSVEKSLNTALDDIRKVQAGSEILPKLREGIHVALIGLPNAGKSTLLNSLLGYDRSIVTEVAGTTRDTISESVEIDGVNYHFTDTAGLNEKPDEVEKIGIEKTIETLKSADIILLLIEPGKSGETYDFIKSNDLPEHIEKNKTITVRTKSDLSAAPKGISISAKSGKGIDKLIKKIQSISDLKDQGSLQILTMRQINILARVEQSLVGLIDKLEPLTNDIIGAELQVAIGDLNELTGDQASNQIIDSIFRNFCIGK